MTIQYLGTVHTLHKYYISILLLIPNELNDINVPRSNIYICMYWLLASSLTPFSLAHRNPVHGVKHDTQGVFSLAWEPPGIASSMAGRPWLLLT